MTRNSGSVDREGALGVPDGPGPHDASGRADPALVQRWIDVGIGAGVAAGVVYALAQSGIARGWFHDLCFLSFGPLLSVAAVGSFFFFRRNRRTVSNQLGHAFVILAGVSFTHMAAMQQSIFMVLNRRIATASGAERELWQSIRSGVSPTQLGLDFAFDIYISVGVALVAIQMIWHHRFNQWFAGLGVVIGVLGLTVNFLTFPENAGQAGLVDPAPFFAVWMSAAAIQVWRCRRWSVA